MIAKGAMANGRKRKLLSWSSDTEMVLSVLTVEMA